MDANEITSDELDALLDKVETVTTHRPSVGAEVRLSIAVDPETLAELTQRARSEGRQLQAVAADALRAGACPHDSARVVRR